VAKCRGCIVLREKTSLRIFELNLSSGFGQKRSKPTVGAAFSREIFSAAPFYRGASRSYMTPARDKGYSSFDIRPFAAQGVISGWFWSCEHQGLGPLWRSAEKALGPV
jgi:hypothetical protein